ncbi:hypothetical protein [Nostoc sp.]|uniref:hypothetical protein n=1 Tax=Nostoc sp. TaxID=1180 RepID=UPI002FFBF57A
MTLVPIGAIGRVAVEIVILRLSDRSTQPTTNNCMLNRSLTLKLWLLAIVLAKALPVNSPAYGQIIQPIPQQPEFFQERMRQQQEQGIQQTQEQMKETWLRLNLQQEQQLQLQQLQQRQELIRQQQFRLQQEQTRLQQQQFTQQQQLRIQQQQLRQDQQIRQQQQFRLQEQRRQQEFRQQKQNL